MARDCCPAMARAGVLAIVLWAWVGCTEDPMPPELPLPSELPSAGTGPTALPSTLSIVSGNAQAGKVGRVLPEPLAVRLTNRQGVGIEDVEVAWESDDDGGDFHGLGTDDTPVSDIVTRTDADGFARVSFTPTSFGIVRVSALKPRYCDYCPDWSQVTFKVYTGDPGASLTLVSGDDQRLKAGEPSEPLIVRVRDSDGSPVPLAAVQWEVKDGQGALGDDGGVARWAHSWTDEDGLARMPVTALWFGPIGVDAEVTGVQGTPVSFSMDASDPGASLTLVSGNGQTGRTDEALEEPLVVRVTNGEGEPVDRVSVDWRIVNGGGRIGELSEPSGNGLHAASVFPNTAGTLGVSASPAGHASDVTFTAEVPVLVVTVYELFGSRFASPGNFYCDPWFVDCPANDTIPLGTTVEWVMQTTSARIFSTSVPTGGSAFDSGTLAGRFRFTPEVTGTWQYVDSLGGAKGSLSVY